MIFDIEQDTAIDGTELGLAWFSPDHAYRYLLTRTWDPDLPLLPFIMLNPSTADAFTDDPTIVRCCGFARRERFGGITVANLYALRASKPAALRGHRDPVGCGNDDVLAGLAVRHPVAVAAWGASWQPAARRARQVTSTLTAAGLQLRCLGVTSAGHPRHPLYVRADQPLTSWPPQEVTLA